ncbi:MAG TPA: tRNA preQ1(34) S-adenosylmethionine ribosyltransferase-isomerase QueA [Candidatus Binatia bacterium]|jgi:S-adenosylmethionine:tRNA ribosyltransferase-isomerase|nr:tRNA preQ1(34) S-adenosylmethionine ribosyltransferase-isomerase QueA [Candidatus Binatia bacterium]
MQLSDFMYELPRSLIASVPAEDRAAARLMVLDRRSGAIRHSDFASIGEFLRAGDVLTLNDTRVFPARIRGHKESGGQAELLLVESFPHWPKLWITLIDSAKKPKVGSRIAFDGGGHAEIIGDMGSGRYGVKFHCAGDFDAWLEQAGETPLPPYVGDERPGGDFDRERYQTVYARSVGAVAAPTAGFHFTPELLQSVRARGVETAFLTLHVGPGTFQPVRDDNIDNHHMEGEWYSLPADAAAKIEGAKARGARVIAVGSTSTRTLEWIAKRNGAVESGSGIARLFVTPGFRFRVLDGLITNFHLPGSTPLVMVAAFAGLELTRRAYDEAIREKYRFYSYGDAMLIL